jgi:hypothetical protein
MYRLCASSGSPGKTRDASAGSEFRARMATPFQGLPDKTHRRS